MSNYELTRVAIRLVEACIAVCVVGRARLRWRAAPYGRPRGTLIARLAAWHQGRVAGAVLYGQSERHRAPTSPTMARRGLFWPRLLVLLAVPVLVAGGVCAATVSAPAPPPRVVEHAEALDPLLVVESFLAARDAHDALAASAFCADLLAINDADGQSWLADVRAVNSWLQQLTQAYSIDMLERPHADGEHIVWTERLSSRAAPFKDALASRIDVRVEVLVRAGKITTYSAWYPSAPPNSPITTGQPPAGPRVAAGAAAVPPVTLFFLSTFGMLFAAALLLSVLPAVWRARATAS